MKSITEMGIRRAFSFAAAAVMACSLFTGCGKTDNDSSGAGQSGEATGAEDTAGKSQVKSFTVTLYSDYYKDTCDSFEKLVKDKYFDDVDFGNIYNGVAAMTKKDDTKADQLVIAYVDHGVYLNQDPFGQITEGSEVADALQNTERTLDLEGIRSIPVSDTRIKKAEMIDDDKDGNHRVEISVEFTEKPERVRKEGTFTITLYPDKAPETCKNFESLVSSGFYNGLTFHRVVADFMAQGGDPKGDGTGGSETNIKGEFSSNGVNNDLSHTRGIVSMARSSDPDSASSQFFICYSDKDTFLDGDYAAFGEVTEGMETVDGFLEVDLSYGSDGAFSSPMTPITIEKAEMLDPDGDGNPRAQFTVKY